MTTTDITPDAARQAGDLLASALGYQGLAWNGAGHLTCSETDSIARALVLLGQPQAAAELIHGHATEDEEGDEHLDLTEDGATAYVSRLLTEED